jgi:predicted protein tyrosine phosphatase
LNVLFVCSRNQWRSPTAEQIFAPHPGLSVRSGGTSVSARLRVSLKDAQWADIILVMEQHHKTRLQAQFRNQLHCPIKVLDIPDNYQYMDPELIQLLETSVRAILQL